MAGSYSHEERRDRTMAVEIRICNQCKKVNARSLYKRMQNIAPQATFKVGCQSYCGIGMKKPFVVVNGKYVSAKTEEELIEKAKKLFL
ncbi:DUF1450 domain-containing protein [Bacillaceae bacterium]